MPDRRKHIYIDVADLLALDPYEMLSRCTDQTLVFEAQRYRGWIENEPAFARDASDVLHIIADIRRERLRNWLVSHA